ncbi:MAG: ribosome biogenesis GTP-binding protein YihA/YsxC [Calditrichia bacterium]
MFRFINPKFIKSTLDWKDGPDVPRPEFAFVGRSNVGKSSLINSLVNIKNFARVSKSPGKTRLINFFDIDEKIYLVDLPGYGFAKTSKAEQNSWKVALEGYLVNSPNLKRLFVLLDGRFGVKSNDEQMLEWLEYENIPFTLIATKLDKLKGQEKKTLTKRINESLELKSNPRIILTSSAARIGKEEIAAHIEELLKKK